jgi:hypothetical protein
MTTAPAGASNQPRGNNWFERNPRKTIFFVLILLFCLCMLGAEKILQRQGLAFRPGYQRFINPREHKPLFSGYIYPTDEDLRNAESLERKRYLLRVDKDGYIFPSQMYQTADLSIVFLGGSTTECLYMGEEERFPYLVGRLAASDLNLKVNSYNAGKAGNNSLHSIDILLNKVMYLQPDLVVMMHNINDLIILLYEKSYWNHNKYKSPLVDVKPAFGQNFERILLFQRDYWIPNLSRAILGLSERVIRAEEKKEFPTGKGEPIEINKSQLLGDFRGNLEIFIDICRHRHLTPVLMTMASRLQEQPDAFIAAKMAKLATEHGISYKNFKEIFDLFNDQIRSVGQANNVMVIDLANRIPPDKRYIYDAVHLTSQGASLASEIIYQNLRSTIRDLASRKSERRPRQRLGTG